MTTNGVKRPFGFGVGNVNSLPLVRWSWKEQGDLVMFRGPQRIPPVILAYHAITEHAPADHWSVSAAAFASQLGWLKEHGFRAVTLQSLVETLRQGTDLAERAVVLTFDDGYEDFVTRALPILQGKGWPATVFLTLSRLGGTSDWSLHGATPALLMTREQALAARASGISLGSHTLTHADLTAVDDGELWRQVNESREALMALGEPYLSFCYPWGRASEREAAAVRAAGYQCAVGGQPSGQPKDLFRLSRVMMDRSINLGTFGELVAGPSFTSRARAAAHRILKGIPSTHGR